MLVEILAICAISTDMWYYCSMEYKRDEHRVHLIVYHLICRLVVDWS